jgi:uridine kinase
MAIEAARRIDPGIKLQLGPSLGFAHIIEVEYGNGYSRGELARMLGEKMRAMVEEDVTYRRERWSVEEARALFRAQGWDSAVRLLRTWRHSTVPLVSCGEVYAVEFGPMVPSTGCFGAFDVVDNDSDLLLYFGDSERKSRDLVDAVHPGRMAREHQQWLRAVGIDSVGAFNDHCITGEVAQIIRISEGFHEKRLSQIADEIVRRQPRIKVICVSGPSSSGKTTFLKRLAVQLQVNGLTPRSISLDNYYVDREFTVRDANGEYDFEAFEALDCKLLEAQLQALVRGETVRLARYDFTTGKSIPSAGPDMHLGPNDVLLVEGIHALNPRLPISHDDGVFRIFINPVTSLPLDCVTRVSVSDIRLLRRIVRDRHSRAITARDNIARWPSVRRGERAHIFPFQGVADAVFNSSLIYEPAVLKVYAERYLLEVPESDEAYTTAYWLRRVIDKFVAIYPDRVPQTSLLREFIGGSSFEH